MDSYLDSLRQMAVHHSQGQFSLDSQKGLSKIRHARATDPIEGIFFAISSAILGGTQKIRFDSGGWMLSLTDYGGPALSTEEAHSLFGHLLSRRNLRLHYLALALHTLSSLNFRRIVYASRSQRIVWTGKEFFLGKPLLTLPFNTLEIWGGSLTRGKSHAALNQFHQSLAERVRERGRFLAGRLQVGGKRVPPGIILPPDCPAAVALTCPGRFQVKASGPIRQEQSPADFSAVLWLKAAPSPTATIVLLEGGVVYETILEQVGYPGWEAVVESSCLEKDLSGKVVRASAYRDFLGQLQAQAAQLLESVPDKHRLLPPWLGGAFPPRSWEANLTTDRDFLAALQGLRISSDGRFLATLAADSLGLWDLQQACWRLRLPPVARACHGCNLVQFCPGTQILAVVCSQSSRWIDCFESQTGSLVASYPHPYTITSIDFDPAGQFLYVSSQDGQVVALENATGSTRTVFRRHDPEAGQDCSRVFVRPSPDGCQLAIQVEGELKIVDLEQNELKFQAIGNLFDWNQTGDKLLLQLLGAYYLWSQGTLAGGFCPELVGSSVSLGPQNTFACDFLGRLSFFKCDSPFPPGEPFPGLAAAGEAGVAHFAEGQLIFKPAWGSPLELNYSQTPKSLMLFAGEWLAAYSQHSQLNLWQLSRPHSPSELGQALAEGKNWHWRALRKGLVVSHDHGLWIWDFTRPGQEFRYLKMGPLQGTLQAQQDWIVPGTLNGRQVVLNRSGDTLWEAEKIYLLGDGLALRWEAEQLSTVRTETGQWICDLPCQGEWRWHQGPWCIRFLEDRARAEIWDVATGSRLVTYGDSKSYADIMSLSLRSDPEGHHPWSLHPSGSWTVTCRRSLAGFHALVCEASEGHEPVCALRLEGAWARECQLRFSPGGAQLGLQLDHQLHLFHFDERSGQLQPRGRRNLSARWWSWCGEALLLSDVAYFEVCQADGTTCCQVYLTQSNYVSSAPLASSWPEPPPIAPEEATSEGEPESGSPLPEGPGLACARGPWPAVDCCPGSSQVEVSPDGRYAVTSSCDQLLVWELASARVLWALPAQPPGSWGIVGDCSCLAVAQPEAEAGIIFLDLASGKERASFPQSQPILLLACVPGRRMVLVDRGFAVWLVDWTSGDCVELCPEFVGRGIPISLTLSPDGLHLILETVGGSYHIRLSIRDIAYRGGEFFSWSGDSRRLLHQEFRRVPSCLYTSSTDSTQWMWQSFTTLDDSFCLSQSGQWILWRRYDPEERRFLGFAQRQKARPNKILEEAESLSQCCWEADQLAVAGPNLAWSVGRQLSLGRFPLLARVSVEMPQPCRQLQFGGEKMLSALSISDQVHGWTLPGLERKFSLGRSLRRGRRAQLARTDRGLVLRTSHEIAFWEAGQAHFYFTPQQGLATGLLQSVPGLVAHSHRAGSWQVLDERGRPLWEAPELRLLSAQRALVRDREGQVWEVEASSGTRIHAILDWSAEWSLESLAAHVWADCPLHERANPWADCDPKVALPYLVPTPQGMVCDAGSEVQLLRAGDPPLALPVSRLFAWESQGQHLISVYPEGEGLSLQSYHLPSGRQCSPSPRTSVDYVPTGGPRLSQDGTRVALQVKQELWLYRFCAATGQLERLEPALRIPTGCGWGWIGNALTFWRANFLQFQGGDGQALLRLYLLEDGFEVARANGSSQLGLEALSEFWHRQAAPV